MKSFKEFIDEETTTGLVAGVRSSDEPPVKKIKQIMIRRKPVDINK